MKDQEKYWTQRYSDNKTGWDLGKVSTPLKEYFDQCLNKEIKILIPGAGNSYEGEYLFENGFKNVDILDISKEPLSAFSNRNPLFPSNQLIETDFFTFQGNYDLIIEQTFFCSFPPLTSTRHLYVEKMHELLNPKGKLIGLWFDIPLKGDLEKRPFGGSKNEYIDYFTPLFDIHTFEKCYNSVESRINTELFGIFIKNSE